MSNQALSAETLAALSRYKAMMGAIMECERVDEVKNIRDKAEALRVYAKEAGNFQAERTAECIRLRAEHRAGQLLKEAKAEGRLGAGRPSENGTAVEPFLESVGITKKESSTWQLLAEVPWHYVEEYARRGKRVTAHSILVKRAARSAGVQEGAPFPKTIRVDFYSIEDMKEFGEKIGQNITMATTSITYPKPYAEFKVNFETLEDREDFAKRIGKEMTLATRTIRV
jgi:hypothetical protein